MGITRRKFIQSTAAGAVAATAAGTTFAQSRARVRWNMPTSWPPHLLLQDSATMFADNLARLTDGEFQIRVYPAGELVPPLEVFDSVQSGTVECAHTWNGYYIGSSNAIGIDGGLPFGLNAEQHRIWREHAGGAELMDEVYEKFNMRSFLCGDTDAQMGGWFNTEINRLEDLRGLRLRIVGLSGRMYERLGASTQAIPGGEILTALERGVIDGVQFNLPHDDLNLGLHEVARYYYSPCWTHPCAPLYAIVNRREWDDLPDDFKEAFRIAASATHAEHVAHSQNKDREALNELLSGEHDVEMRVFPDDVMEAASEVNDDIVNEFADEDPDFDRIYPHWKAFLDDIRQLNKVTRYPLDQFAYER